MIILPLFIVKLKIDSNCQSRFISEDLENRNYGNIAASKILSCEIKNNGGFLLVISESVTVCVFPTCLP